jgi:DNA-binding MarR family transcriptional regulator
MAVTDEEPQQAAAAANGDELAASWHELLGRYHRTNCALDRALSVDHAINVSEFEVLQQVHEAGGDMRMHGLAEQVHLTQSALSRLITRIEEAGLVTRCMCTDDRRAIFIQLTDAGETRYLEAKPTHRSTLLALAAGETPGCSAAE